MGGKSLMTLQSQSLTSFKHFTSFVSSSPVPSSFLNSFWFCYFAFCWNILKRISDIISHIKVSVFQYISLKDRSYFIYTYIITVLLSHLIKLIILSCLICLNFSSFRNTSFMIKLLKSGSKQATHTIWYFVLFCFYLISL